MSGDLNGGVEVAREAAHGLRVLVVDDEMLIRWALGQALGSRGCLVTEAADARQALAAVRAEDFDAIVLDYRLPDTTHLDLLRGIRALSPESHIVMMTAFGTPETLKEAMDLGVSRVLDKPIDLDVAVKAILER
jgi:DNA-binding NtrC family response regulator